MNNKSWGQAVGLAIAAIIFCFALGQFSYFAWLSLGFPILEMSGYRTSQTALSVYYMTLSQGWLANIVPIFGRPWIFVQEFPIFQWCVAIFALVTHTPIDPAGRLISAAFAIGCVWPFWLVARELRPSAAVRITLIAGALWLGAPVIVYWGKAFLIETTVVFMSACWLAFYVRLLNRGNVIDLIWCAVFGAVAAMIKPPVFSGFVILGAFLTPLIWRRSNWTVGWTAKLAASVFVPAVFMMVWSIYSEWTLALNPLSSLLLISKNKDWYFGNWADRTSSLMWGYCIGKRDLPQVLGTYWYAPILAVPFLWRRPIALLAALAAIIAYLSAYLIFPKLHIYNPYYGVENALLLVIAAVIFIEAAISTRFSILGYALVGFVVYAQAQELRNGLLGPFLYEDLKQNPSYKAGLLLRDKMPPHSVLVAFGVDYSSDLAYYSQHKTLDVANQFPEPTIKDMLFGDRERWLGAKIGAVADCHGFPAFDTGGYSKEVRDQLIREIGSRPIVLHGKIANALDLDPMCSVYLAK